MPTEIPKFYKNPSTAIILSFFICGLGQNKERNTIADPMKVVLKITSVKGTCAAGHKVGEEFDLSKDFVLGYQVFLDFLILFTGFFLRNSLSDASLPEARWIIQARQQKISTR